MDAASGSDELHSSVLGVFPAGRRGQLVAPEGLGERASFPVLGLGRKPALRAEKAQNAEFDGLGGLESRRGQAKLRIMLSLGMKS
jgi:hypothetical protein